MGTGKETQEGRMSGEVMSIESEFVKFSISPENGCYYFLDKQSGVEWNSNPYAERMGEVTMRIDGESQRFPLRSFRANQARQTIRLSYCQQTENTVLPKRPRK